IGLTLLVDLLEGPRPRWPAVPVAGALARLFLETGEEVAPLVAHRTGVALVLRLHLLDVGGVGALQERGAREGFVLGLASHVRSGLWRWSGSDRIARNDDRSAYRRVGLTTTSIDLVQEIGARTPRLNVAPNVLTTPHVTRCGRAAPSARAR